MNCLLKKRSLVSFALGLGCNFASALLAEEPDQSVVEIQSDLTDLSQALSPIRNFWSVNARTEQASLSSNPAHAVGKPKVSTVRMLGGWRNQNLNGDAYKWNGTTYVYDWQVLTDRIDGWINSGWDIFQIVLDNPPWAFQRDLTFVAEPDGVHYLESSRNGVYGNVLPPNDPQAWSDFIEALMHKLVATYGRETVQQWRFRVGSEIDTRPQHWAGTMAEFFDHYKDTIDAVHAVLPTALVGTHFREASYRGKYVDYLGKTENAYGPDFVAWAKQNDVSYDFLAISFYPNINQAADGDMAEVYAHEIAPIKDHPDWNPAASFEIHEYKFISKMLRANFVGVATTHGAAYFASLAKMAVANDIREIFQWGAHHEGLFSPDAMTQQILQSMVGTTAYRNTLRGAPSNENTHIDSIISARPTGDGFDALVFSYNPQSPAYETAESIRLRLTVPLPAGTKFTYRITRLDRETHGINRFFLDHPKTDIPVAEGGWRIPDRHISAPPAQALAEEGVEVFVQSAKNYPKYNELNWSDWKAGYTKHGDDQQSQISITGEIPSFAVHKYEIRFTPFP